MTRPTSPRDELRALVLSKIVQGLASCSSPARWADTVMELFAQVGDEWDRIDVSTVSQGRGTSAIEQRWLVARVPAQMVRNERPTERTGSQA